MRAAWVGGLTWCRPADVLDDARTGLNDDVAVAGLDRRLARAASAAGDADRPGLVVVLDAWTGTRWEPAEIRTSP